MSPSWSPSLSSRLLLHSEPPSPKGLPPPTPVKRSASSVLWRSQEQRVGTISWASWRGPCSPVSSSVSRAQPQSQPITSRFPQFFFLAYWPHWLEHTFTSSAFSSFSFYAAYPLGVSWAVLSLKRLCDHPRQEPLPFSQQPNTCCFCSHSPPATHWSSQRLSALPLIILLTSYITWFPSSWHGEHRIISESRSHCQQTHGLK